MYCLFRTHPSTTKYLLTVYPKDLATSYSKSNIVFLHIDQNTVPRIQDTTITHALLVGHSVVQCKAVSPVNAIKCVT